MSRRNQVVEILHMFRKNAVAILGSPRLMTILFFTVICSLAVGTFLDAGAAQSPSAYTETIIFKSKWLEVVIGLLALNFIINIFKYNLIQRKQWSVLLLHMAFLLIILGAGITRYFGYEGIVNIREGQTVDSFYSYDTYLDIFIDGFIEGQPKRSRTAARRVRFSERLSNNFKIVDDFDGKQVKFEVKDYKSKVGVEQKLVPNDSGTDYLLLVENSNGQRNEHFLKRNSSVRIGNSIVAFGELEQNSTIEIRETANGLELRSSRPGLVQDMITEEKDTLVANLNYPLKYLRLYQFGNLSFVIPKKVLKGNLEEVLVPDPNSSYDAIQVEISVGKTKQLVYVSGRSGEAPVHRRITIDNLFVHIAYGSKKHELPFSITLNDFIADKFPGRDKVYKAFKSKVSVQDIDPFNYDIYMNETLTHKGYRFFQASFDEDEKGTYLSVNHDLYGTWTSYAGYLLLFAGLIFLLVDGKSRVSSLTGKIRLPKAALVLFALLSFSINEVSGNDQDGPASAQAYQYIESNAIDETVASAFGKLIVQDERGRMKPINTYSAELLRKISKNDKFGKLDSDQVILSFIQFPEEWVSIELIKLKKGNDSIRNILNIPQQRTHAALNDFYHEDQTLKLPAKLLQKASRGFNPSQFEKDILRAFQDQYLLGQALKGEVLRIFPLPNDSTNTWVSYQELSGYHISYLSGSFQELAQQVFEERNTNAALITQFVQALDQIQRTYGKEVVPEPAKVDFEVMYNRLNIFERLFLWNLLLGLSLVLFSVAGLFWDSRIIKFAIKIHRWLIYGLFGLFLFGLISRWYISGHAPWSDAYESMVYVAFITLLFGIILGRHSSLTLASTCFVSSMILMVAHWNFIDPAITNLVPVLDSYWLMIHVAIIVASYGPFTLSMTVGLLALVISVFVNSRNIDKVRSALQELTTINEISMTIGLIMLSIGNFLGAMWANESWGRYWAWDPKETWALISIMIYAFVLHMRLIPGLKSKLTLTVASVIAYASILMTYFGVNFYLTGLHSYANGSQIAGLSNFWIILGGLATLYAISYRQNKRYKFI